MTLHNQVAGAVATDDEPAELGPSAGDEAAAPGVLGCGELSSPAEVRPEQLRVASRSRNGTMDAW